VCRIRSFGSLLIDCDNLHKRSSCNFEVFLNYLMAQSTRWYESSTQ